MSIYTSEKVMPYVYMCIHKNTKQFYIGSRVSQRQKLPSHLDFPKYKTSSKYVKPIFNEFDWYIVAEFLDRDSTYNFEQELICENFNNCLILNKSHFYNKTKFSNAGRIASVETRQKQSEAGKGRKKSKEHREKIGISNTNPSPETRLKMSKWQIGKIVSPETCKNISDALRGKPLKEETKIKISISGKIAQSNPILREKHRQANLGRIPIANLRTKERLFLKDKDAEIYLKNTEWIKNRSFWKNTRL